MFFIMYGYKSVWIRSLSDVEVRKSCIKEVFAFFGNLNLEKWHKYADFGVKYIFFAMQNGNYCDFCLVVNGFYITFASEYIFYIKLVKDNWLYIKRCIQDKER